MPESAIAAAPAPAAAAAPAPKAAPPLANAPKVELKPADLGVPKDTAPAKPGSAKSKMFEELRKKADPNYKPAEPAEKPNLPDKKEGDEDEDPAAPAPDAKEGEAAAAAAAAKPAKVSPWKLVEEHKAARAAAEAKLIESEKRAIPEAKWKEKEAALEASTKRLNELEEEIRFVNYSKSKEFNEKYQQPYQAAWNRAMGELGELLVQETNGDGEPMGEARAVTPNDILELVNMPLGRAFEAARAKFGDLAPEVMAHRKEIRKLADEQGMALETARKSGGEREKAMTEQQQKQYAEVSGSIKETWSKANEEVKADEKYGVYLKPRDGDEQGNQRLAKGYEMADRAFSENPLAPGLTTEQRQSIVKRHAAVRNRAAAFGRLVYDLGLSRTEVADLKKQLAEYQGSEPNRDGSKKNPQPVQRSAKEGMFDALRKLAKNV
jgi:hypothetical protein